MQILLSSQQRNRLRREAKRRGTSVAALIREAIDRSFETPESEDRHSAYKSIVARRAQFVSPPELDELIEGRFD